MEKKSKLRFFGAFSPREELIGILGYPIVFDKEGIEFTRFCTVKNGRWGKNDFDSDIVNVIQTTIDGSPCWWLAGKRGDIHTISAAGSNTEFISDAGTGPGKYGYLSSMRFINNSLYACGFSRQIYRRTPEGWAHYDQGILDSADNLKHSLEDIDGLSDGTLCAVGFLGEIALFTDGQWKLQDSPTNLNLHAVCSDGKKYFYAAGARGTVIRISASSGIEILCSGDIEDSLWDIRLYHGEPVVSASDGLFYVRDNKLVPFDTPTPPPHVGYKLCIRGELLWSIGTHQIFCLKDNQWAECVCPDNQ